MLIDVTVQGIAPLMMDAFSNELLIKGPKSTSGKEELDPKVQAENRLYKDKDGTIIWPVNNLLSCIIDAGRFIKIGKRQLSTRDTTTVTSFLRITDNYIPIKSEHGWRVHAGGVTNQATKGKHVCFRPLFDDWQFSFTLDVDPKEASLNTVRELIDRAGKSIGIGVMRPSRKGAYGQFKVISWAAHKELKEIEAA